MAWIVDVESLGLEKADTPNAYVAGFDVIYPGECYTRSMVWVRPDAAQGTEDEIIGRARDALLEVLEREGVPTSVEMALSAEGASVMEIGHPVC